MFTLKESGKKHFWKVIFFFFTKRQDVFYWKK